MAVVLILVLVPGAVGPSVAAPVEKEEPQVAPAVAPPIRVGAAPT